MKRFFKQIIWAIAALVAFSLSAQAYQGMPIPKLHVSGRNLLDPSGKAVLLHGYMQAGASWFNGGGNLWTDPSDYSNASQCAGMLNGYNAIADILSNPNPMYGRNHGWYCGYVRLCGHGTPNGFAPGWDSNGNLARPAEFNGWLQNIIVPWVNHCKSVGLYVIICGTPSQTYPGDDATKNMTYQFQQNLISYWSTVANYPGIKSADNVMFEICNEPISIESSFGANDWGGHWGAIQSFMQPIANAIRNTGADNIILIPGLGWQGDCSGYANYPISGSNIAYSGHFYPAYGGVYDNATSVQNYWNSNFKPIADRAPLFFTEIWWNPNDGTGYQSLWNAHTNGFGNALKSAIDNQGNVHYLVGMVGDLLANMNLGLANTSLGSGEGCQAWFEWLPTYTWAAPTYGGGATFYQNYYYGGASSQTLGAGSYTMSQLADKGMPNDWASSVRVPSGYTVTMYENGDFTGSYWTLTADTPEFGPIGANDLVSSVVVELNITGTKKIVARHSGKAIDVSGGQTSNGTQLIQWPYWGGTNQQWTVTDEGNGEYSIRSVQSGKSIDISNWGTDNGTKVQLWDYFGTTNQRFYITETDSGYYRITPTHAPNSCLDVEGVSTADNANIHLWTWLGGQNQQWAFQEP